MVTGPAVTKGQWTSSTASKLTNVTSTVFRNLTALTCVGGRNS
ncbi:hypothetical protein FVER14953_21412 [Fusarium verticillioides]|nr:hypothetical protein FVER14953_21412 [Fusarium verticillioides]